MPLKGVMCLIMILVLPVPALQEESYWNLSLENQGQDSGKTKYKSEAARHYENDLLMGYFIAVVPGFIIHGAGNIYAGNATRGTILLGVELTGILLALSAVGDRWEYKSNGEKVNNNTYILDATALILFIGSWAWDIATVGGEIRKRHPENLEISIGPLPTMNKYQSASVFGVKLAINF